MSSPPGPAVRIVGEQLRPFRLRQAEIERPERLAFVSMWDGPAGHEGRQLVEVEFTDLGDLAKGEDD
jgi:hypothetical protein